MTTTLDNKSNKSRLMQQLISSCYRSQADFRCAAEAVNDSSLKRLFEIYAQQRTRFAEELREHLPLTKVTTVPAHSTGEPRPGTGVQNDCLRHCLDSEVRTLQVYKQALADRALPTRTQFLVSSQLALMQRVHDRVNSLVEKPERNQTQAVTALRG